LRYFHTLLLEKVSKMHGHFGAFGGVFTSDSRKFVDKIISILAHFEIFSHMNTGNFWGKIDIHFGTFVWY
jgi:hypothetical protein